MWLDHLLSADSYQLLQREVYLLTLLFQGNLAYVIAYKPPGYLFSISKHGGSEPKLRQVILILKKLSNARWFIVSGVDVESNV